ncbi:MAG: DUF4330 domain-containing protein [Actinobacteria bacterium]|nr:DUF4330 domain-containing protein [Actinomycetota bacterium]
MRLIDDKGRLFGRINVIDLLVVILVLALAGRFSYSRYISKSLKAIRKEQKPIEVVLVVGAVRQPTVDAIRVGSKVMASKTSTLLGEVVKVEAKPANVVFTGNDGRTYEMPSPSRLDVYVTLRGLGQVSENAVFLGDTEVRVGTLIDIRSNIYAGSGVVYQINPEPK